MRNVATDKCRHSQAEKLKVTKWMKDEGWKMKDERWGMKGDFADRRKDGSLPCGYIYLSLHFSNLFYKAWKQSRIQV